MRVFTDMTDGPQPQYILLNEMIKKVIIIVYKNYSMSPSWI